MHYDRKTLRFTLPSYIALRSSQLSTPSRASSLSTRWTDIERDNREFPSLSGAPQSQQQNPGQAVWGGARMGQQQNTVTRQQPSNPPQASHQSQPTSQNQNSHQDLFPNSQQFADGLDEFRHGAQGIGSQLSAQPQTGNIEEFPPLGREGQGPPGQERRGSLMQGSSAYGALGGMGFSSLGQQPRNPLSNPQDRIASPGSGGRPNDIYL